MSVTLLSYCYSLRQGQKYMRLSKILRIKVALAVPYCLWWLVTGGFICWGGFDISCSLVSRNLISNTGSPIGVIESYPLTFIGHFVPLVLLFATDIWRWIKAGDDK